MGYDILHNQTSYREGRLNVYFHIGKPQRKRPACLFCCCRLLSVLVSIALAVHFRRGTTTLHKHNILNDDRMNNRYRYIDFNCILVGNKQTSQLSSCGHNVLASYWCLISWICHYWFLYFCFYSSTFSTTDLKRTKNHSRLQQTTTDPTRPGRAQPLTPSLSPPPQPWRLQPPDRLLWAVTYYCWSDDLRPPEQDRRLRGSLSWSSELRSAMPLVRVTEGRRVSSRTQQSNMRKDSMKYWTLVIQNSKAG